MEVEAPGRSVLWAGLGLLLFGVYLHTAGPTVVPYRDAGEMATTVSRLGILHPPGYPLYTLTGKAWVTAVPWADAAYRLNAFSAFCMASAFVLLGTALARAVGFGPALGAVALGGLSYEFWWHALISEMYALHVLVIAFLLWALSARRWWLACWGFGLGLANRPDLLLLAPGLAAFLVLDPGARAWRDRRAVLIAASLVVIGLALYAYLPLRALQQPWMNWNDPSTWDRFLGTLLRRGYGSGLDRLAENYRPGENFWPQFALYLQHLWRDFTPIGVGLALIGAAALWRRRFSWALLALSGWTLSGPLFIYLGNLPINSHAVAILEAAYLAPDVFVVLFIGVGLAALVRLASGRLMAGAVYGAVALAAYINAVGTAPDVDKRHNWLAYDFARHVRRSTPPGALVVARSDVPLFSLYYAHWAAGSSRLPIAQGLAASPWYQEMIRRYDPGVEVGPLRAAEDWQAFHRLNAARPLFATFDIEWPSPAGGFGRSRGLVTPYASVMSASAPPPDLREFYVWRGRYQYGAYRDFFSNELIELYAKAWMALGDEAALRMAWVFKPDMPYPPFQLGYLAYTRRDWPRAVRYYRQTLRLFDGMERLAVEWKSLPAVRRQIEADHALARRHYQAALAASR